MISGMGRRSVAVSGGLALLTLAVFAMAERESAWHPAEVRRLQYRVQNRFGLEPSTMPGDWSFGRVSAVATDSTGQEVYVFQRGKQADPIIVFSSKGKYLRSWGRGMFSNPHGLRLDRDNNVWVTDNADHQVMKFTRDGKLLLTLGIKGKAGTDTRTFNRPTDIAFAQNGDFYVSDGYGNSRVVKFSKAGKYILDWGKKGSAPGKFDLPHSVQTDSKGLVYVSDRENNRIQIFDPNGNFLKQWSHLGATQSIFITPQDDIWVLTHRDNEENLAYDSLAGRIFHLELATGKVLGSIGSPGHWLNVSSTGDLFVGCVTGNVFHWTPGWMKGMGKPVPPDAK